MWSLPGCPDTKRALPGSPAAPLTNHVHWGTIQDLTAAAATTFMAKTVWSCYATKPPHQITLKQITNRASGAPPSTHYFRAVRPQGGEMRGARPVCQLLPRSPCQLDQFRQEPTRLPLHPDLCHFGATMACILSQDLQPTKAFLELMTKHAPEWKKMLN